MTSSIRNSDQNGVTDTLEARELLCRPGRWIDEDEGFHSMVGAVDRDMSMVGDVGVWLQSTPGEGMASSWSTCAGRKRRCLQFRIRSFQAHKGMFSNHNTLLLYQYRSDNELEMRIFFYMTCESVSHLRFIEITVSNSNKVCSLEGDSLPILVEV